MTKRLRDGELDHVIEVAKTALNAGGSTLTRTHERLVCCAVLDLRDEVARITADRDAIAEQMRDAALVVGLATIHEASARLALGRAEDEIRRLRADTATASRPPPP